MKQNRSRLIALLLALCLLVGALPTLALADDAILTMDDYQNARNRVEEALAAPDVPVEQTNQHYVARSSEVESIVKSTVTGDLSVDSATAFALPVAGRLELRAPEAEAYRWQIRVGDQWANIVGDTESEMVLTYAKLQNALSGNAAVVRCALTRAGETVYTAEATVTVDPNVETETTTVTEQIPVTSYYQPSAVSRAKALNEGVMAANDQSDTCSVVINYVFANGDQAISPWTATVAKGSSIKQDVVSPTITGYTPDYGTYPVDETNVQTDKTFTVTYTAADVGFTVKHYQQNVVDDNKYTLVDADTEKKSGFTDTEIGKGHEKTYPGFTALLYDTTTKIAADGSTVVEIYYDRNYYLMNFNLDGGYGVEPIYARFGAPISVGTPTKPGYTFVSWTPSIPSTMPDENTSYTASWKIGESGFTVVFWYENANDDGYSVAGTYKPADVKPGTEKKSDDYKNQSFTGRDTKHFTYNAAKAETVTVKGDGSTVLNVYYTRNTYTLKFRYLDCDKWFLHTHNDNCYKVIKTITAKYQADIHSNFPIKESNETIWWEVPVGCKSFKPGMQLGSIDTMPGEDITFKSDDTQSGATLYYYLETLNGEKGTYSHGGKNFELYKQITLNKYCQLTYTEEFHNISGFTQWWSDPEFDKMEQGGVAYEGITYDDYYYIKDNNYLCYTRNSYNLKFYNYNAYVDGKGGSVQYEAPLKTYNFTPEYPAGLESNAYEFAGWYTTAGCYDGSEVNWDTMTMPMPPASEVILYAKWAPKTHTVTFAKTEGAEPEETQTVAHGEKAKEYTTENGNYTFVGWFYKDEDGVEHAFDLSMAVRRDMNLYAKWRATEMASYIIHYQLQDGTPVADDTKGSALNLSTKTFYAKGGSDLNKDYQSGYFPETNSHSITMDINGTNEYTFIYIPVQKVNYTVRYLEKGTNKVLHTEKTDETSNAVITETFVAITGYAPDAYQKRLVLSANEEENVLIFWYVADTEHAPVQIIHWTQNIEGEGYTEYQSSTNLNGVIREGQTSTALSIPGFAYAEGTAVAGETTTKFTKPSTPNAVLTAAGLVLNLYYDRIEYPYEFRFREQGTDKELADPVTGNARYQAQVTQTAKPIPGYTLASAENQAINIAIEDGTTAVKNVKIFYYTEQTVDIKYEVVGPDGCGTLDNYQDVQLKVTTGEVKGSTPTATDGFKFVGWYKDKDCTQLVDTAWVADSKLTPVKTKNYGTAEAPVMGYEAATYYAKFEYDVADLTITKQGWEEIDENQSFIFDVTGPGITGTRKVVIKGNKSSVTIKGLKVGTYTVTEVTSWSWRYEPANNASAQQKITLDPTGKNEVTFKNTRTKDKWLGGDAYSKNEFKTSANASTN